MLTNVEELESVYGKANERSVRKEISFISEDYAAFILASPFVMLASAGEDGLDCSPKGDAMGFVRILDAHTLAIPDRPGNNRIDTLRNLVQDPRIALLFLVPGAGEMMRVNGRASIADDTDLLASFSVNGKPPRTVILVHVESVYFHCSKAVVRSDLWNAEKHVDRASLPSAGAMLKNVSDSTFDADAYDRALPGRLKTDLY
ncbi:MAG: pyridoxamine 5'-phosphate oxidase family protein [Pseudomonadota bacterium]|jgi:PPOX class probable FMN-dependent enzyme|uniref:Phosphohydrolase (MutT/nudix family protein) n=1 Tax=Caballeronia sordidicola TaxID=196367 RepID=A0A242MB96_CABSO|nr:MULTISPECIES: pyridoxamine 5'-phosphate oxidase family protein [Burkholderiaceae]AMH43111.1 pyridoxamine 5'-phosphate oxidase [Burkholderia sp. PAMC 26561]MDP9157509.1 pyridoxamine 5'-phosphate oxidase family protein [Pseudomonadota bacterium]OTP68460.1 Phosphohydrolase (MutT/nudix family protein) [Caballeronia sordidicola]OTP73063.1 Phosphohydrolase (MutT/nudix family protein) [Caballeronia sordidicola]